MGQPQLRSTHDAPASAAILAALTPSSITFVAIWKPAATYDMLLGQRSRLNQHRMRGQISKAMRSPKQGSLSAFLNRVFSMGLPRSNCRANTISAWTKHGDFVTCRARHCLACTVDCPSWKYALRPNGRESRAAPDIVTSAPNSEHSRLKGRLPPLVSGARISFPFNFATRSTLPCTCCCESLATRAATSAALCGWCCVGAGLATGSACIVLVAAKAAELVCVSLDFAAGVQLSPEST